MAPLRQVAAPRGLEPPQVSRQRGEGERKAACKADLQHYFDLPLEPRVPMIGISSLDLLAFPLRHADRTIAAVIDARKGELFYAFYRPVPGGVQRVLEPRCGRVDDLIADLARRLRADLPEPAQGFQTTLRDHLLARIERSESDFAIIATGRGGKDDPKLQLLRFDPGKAQIWLNDRSLFAGIKLLLGRDPKQEYKDKVADQAWGGFDEGTAAGLCYTSGTTGNPKGVLYGHRSNYLHTMMSLQPDALNLSARDTVLLIVPMYHANAWGVMYSAPMVGAKLVLPGQKMDGASLHELIETEGVTYSAAVPTVWGGLLTYLRESGKRIDGLRRVLIGGCLATVATGLVLAPLMQSGSLLLVGLFLSLALFVMGFVYGPLGAWLPGLFPARVRYTGASMAFNAGGIIGGGLAPIIAQALADRGGLAPVGWYLAACAIAATWSARSRRMGK